MAQRRSWLPPRSGGYAAVEPADEKRAGSNGSKPAPPKGRAGISKPDKVKAATSPQA
jgi:hypothetical protein